MKTVTLILAAFAILHVADAVTTNACKGVFPSNVDLDSFVCGKTIDKDPKSIFYCFDFKGSAYVKQFPHCLNHCVTATVYDKANPSDILYESHCEGGDTPTYAITKHVGKFCGSHIKQFYTLQHVKDDHLYGLTFYAMADLGGCHHGCNSKALSGGFGQDECK